jgi:hypothetical protein
MAIEGLSFSTCRGEWGMNGWKGYFYNNYIELPIFMRKNVL